MKKTNVEKLLKRFLKRKTRITLATVICFLLSSYGLQAQEIILGKDETIQEKQEFKENTTITQNNGIEIINNNKLKDPITIDCSDYDLIMNNILNGTQDREVSYASTVATVDGSTTINAKNLTIRTEFITADKFKQDRAIFYLENKENPTNVVLDAENITLIGKGTKKINGISLENYSKDSNVENKFSVKNNQNFTIELEGTSGHSIDNDQGIVTGISLKGGTVDIESANLFSITVKGESANGIYLVDDKNDVNIDAGTIKINVTGTGNDLSSSVILGDGKVNLHADNDIILTLSEEQTGHPSTTVSHAGEESFTMTSGRDIKITTVTNGIGGV